MLERQKRETVTYFESDNVRTRKNLRTIVGSKELGETLGRDQLVQPSHLIDGEIGV